MNTTESLSPALVEAIKAHQAAITALDASKGPDDLLEHLSDADSDAALAVATAPSLSDAELIKKLRHLFAYECRMWGEPDASYRFGLLATALKTHFDQEVRT